MNQETDLTTEKIHIQFSKTLITCSAEYCEILGRIEWIFSIECLKENFASLIVSSFGCQLINETRLLLTLIN